MAWDTKPGDPGCGEYNRHFKKNFSTQVYTDRLDLLVVHAVDGQHHCSGAHVRTALRVWTLLPWRLFECWVDCMCRVVMEGRYFMEQCELLVPFVPTARTFCFQDSKTVSVFSEGSFLSSLRRHHYTILWLQPLRKFPSPEISRSVLVARPAFLLPFIAESVTAAYVSQVGFFGVQVVLAVCFSSVLSTVHTPAACVLMPVSFQPLVSHLCPGACTGLTWSCDLPFRSPSLLFQSGPCLCAVPASAWRFPLSSICSGHCLQTSVLDTDSRQMAQVRF